MNHRRVQSESIVEISQHRATHRSSSAQCAESAQMIIGLYLKKADDAADYSRWI